MKKIKIIAIILTICPLVALAEVDENTPVTIWEANNTEAKNLCYQEEAKNNEEQLGNANKGYYMSCIEIQCNNGINSYIINNAIANKIKCTNKNINPTLILVSSGAFGIKEGTNCSLSGTYAYATEKYFYNCEEPKEEEIVEQKKTPEKKQKSEKNNNKKNTSWWWTIIIPILIIGIIALLIRNKLKRNASTD